MKTKSRSRCAIKAARWASYAVAGAATAVLASNDAEAQVFYSGALNTPVGAPPGEVWIKTLIGNSHQGTFKLGYFKHLENGEIFTNPLNPAGISTCGVAEGKMLAGHSYFHAGAVSGQIRGAVLGKYNYGYASKLAFGAKVSAGAFDGLGHSNRLASYFKGFGSGPNSQFKTAGTGYLGFEFNLGGGEQYGWIRVNMAGEIKNNFTIVDYAYGAVGQAITAGEEVVPATGTFTWIATVTSPGSWNAAGNWTPSGGPPDAAGITAIFANTNPCTVTLDGNQTVGNLQFNAAGSITIDTGSPQGALIFDNGTNAATLTVTAGSHTINAPIALNSTTDITLSSSTSLTLGGPIANGTEISGLTLAGGGTLIFSGANGYSGATTISGGTLKAGATDTMSAASAVSVGSGGTLLLNGFSQSIGSLTGAGPVTNNSNTGVTLTVGNDGTSPAAYSGTLSNTTASNSGTLALTKIGAGTLILSGANTYSGGTNVNGGVLSVANTAPSSSGTGSGAVMVNSGGTLGGTGAIGGPVTVNSSGTLAPGGSANLTINNSLTLGTGAIQSDIFGTPGVANAGPAGGNDLTTVNGALTLNPSETVDVAAGTGFGTGTYVLAHYSSLVNNSNNFSGWTVNGPISNNYTLQIDTANKDLELVSRPKAPTQNLFVSDDGSAGGQGGALGEKILQLTPSGSSWVQTTYANLITGPEGLAFDSNGNLLVAGDGNGTLIKIPAGGGSYTVVGGPNLQYAYGLAVDSSNNVYVSSQSPNLGAPANYPTVLKFSGPSYTMSSFITQYPTAATSSSLWPGGLAIDASGDLWVASATNPPSAGTGSIREFSTSGATLIQTLGGLTAPDGMAFDAGGDLFVADSSTGDIYKYAFGTWTQSVFATGLPKAVGLAINAFGDVFVSVNAVGNADQTGYIDEYAPNGSLIGTVASGLSYPLYITLSSPPPSWTGGHSTTNWSDSGNWSTGVVPGSTSSTIDTDTALFNQNAGGFSPLAIDMNRNVMNITFDNSAGLLTSSLTIGATGGNSLLLTDGGTIQITASVANPQNVNAPLILEGTPGTLTNSYNFINNSTTSTATLSFGGAISSGASMGVTTLSLSGTNAGTNIIGGPISNGTSGATVALSVPGSTWELTAANTYSGGTTIGSSGTLVLADASGSAMTKTMNIANSGSLVVATANQVVGTVTGSGSVVVNASSSLTAYQIRQNSLTIGSGALVTLAASGSGSTTNPAGPNNINFSSNVTSLNIAGTLNAWTGTLDIGNNGLVIAYGTLANDPYTTINNMIESGYNGGVWGGTGINSTLAQAGVTMHISMPLNIGLLDFTPGTGNYSNTTFISFEGQTITTNAILVRLTYMDDLVLAGDMASNDATSDALLFAANYGTGTTWGVGDLVHNGGPINSSDALLFAANYVVGLASLDGSTGGEVSLASGEAAVPEPASLGLLAIGAVGLLAIRRARKRKNRPAASCLASVELFVPDLGDETLLPLATLVGPRR